MWEPTDSCLIEKFKLRILLSTLNLFQMIWSLQTLVSIYILSLSMNEDCLKPLDVYMIRQTDKLKFLISKALKLKIPVDIQLELFDSVMCPILLYEALKM